MLEEGFLERLDQPPRELLGLRRRSCRRRRAALVVTEEVSLPDAELHRRLPLRPPPMHAWGLGQQRRQALEARSRPSTEKLNELLGPSRPSSRRRAARCARGRQSRVNSIVSAPPSAGSFGIVLSGRLDLRNELAPAR